jgi:hypothetical protein
MRPIVSEIRSCELVYTLSATKSGGEPTELVVRLRNVVSIGGKANVGGGEDMKMPIYEKNDSKCEQYEEKHVSYSVPQTYQPEVVICVMRI